MPPSALTRLAGAVVAVLIVRGDTDTDHAAVALGGVFVAWAAPHFRRRARGRLYALCPSA